MTLREPGHPMFPAVGLDELPTPSRCWIPAMVMAHGGPGRHRHVEAPPQAHLSGAAHGSGAGAKVSQSLPIPNLHKHTESSAPRGPLFQAGEEESCTFLTPQLRSHTRHCCFILLARASCTPKADICWAGEQHLPQTEGCPRRYRNCLTGSISGKHPKV